MSASLARVDQDVARLALLRDGINVLLLVLVVERFQFGIGGIDLLLDVVKRQDGVVELDLGALLFDLLFNFLVADGRRRATTAASNFCCSNLAP